MGRLLTDPGTDGRITRSGYELQAAKTARELGLVPKSLWRQMKDEGEAVFFARRKLARAALARRGPPPGAFS